MITAGGPNVAPEDFVWAMALALADLRRRFQGQARTIRDVPDHIVRRAILKIVDAEEVLRSGRGQILAEKRRAVKEAGKDA